MTCERSVGSVGSALPGEQLVSSVWGDREHSSRKEKDRHNRKRPRNIILAFGRRLKREDQAIAIDAIKLEY